MANLMIRMSVVSILALAETASASTIYVLMKDVHAPPVQAVSSDPVDLGPWEISEGPVDYAPDSVGTADAYADEQAEFAVMEPSGKSYQGLFFNPQD